MMKCFNFVCTLIVVLFSMLTLGFGQGEGIPPFSTQQIEQFDSIDLANDNILVEIPVRSKAGAIPLSFSLTANSNMTRGGNSNLWFWRSSTFPLSLQSPVSLTLYPVATNTHYPCPDNVTFTTLYTDFYLIDETGARHDFAPGGSDPVQVDTKGCEFINSGSFTQDGSGYTVALLGGNDTVVGTIRDPHGNSLTTGICGITCSYFGSIASSLADTNGNQIIRSLAGVYTDSLGQTALTATIGTLANPDTYSYTDVNSATKAITVTKTTFTQKTVFGCAGITDINGYTVYLPTSISFPDGSSMAFTYEPTPGVPADTTGRIKMITLPTGGTVTFGYSGGANNGINCTDGTVPTLTRATSDGTWTYVHTPPVQTGATSTTTVTDPSGNATVYTFSGLYQTQRQSYQGAVGGSLLQTVLTCYNNILTNCPAPTGGVTLPIVQKNVYATVGSKTSQTALYYDGNGQITKQEDYDFFLNGSYPLLKRTQIVYAVNGNGLCPSIGATIKDRPCSITVTNGTYKLSELFYAYDAAGNITQVSRLVSGNTYQADNFTYDANGALKTRTDANWTVTTYTNDTCNNVFPSSVSVAGFSMSATWNCSGGVKASSTDANGQPTTYSYNDPLWRLKSTTDPLSNVTTMAYLTGTSSYVNSSTPFNGSNSTIDITTFVDGLGRVKRVQQKKSPSATTYDTDTTTYNANGQLFKSTRPCTVAWNTDCSLSPATTTTYDALGRTSSITDGGSTPGTVTWAYTNNDALQTVGPTTPVKVKQFEYDGLGRLTSVCEVTGTGGGNCGQTTVKTGYWTKYTYGAIGDGQVTFTVTQNVQGTSQIRTYSYDGLGRLTKEINPENGTVQYFYDSGSSGPGAACNGIFNGDLVKKYDANGNTSCFTYDGLHRVLSTTYSGPNSTGVNRYFIYDSATVGGQTMLNAAGRLAEAYTAATQTSPKITDLGFSYSPRGEQTDTYELTPHSGANYYHVIQSYWADGNVHTLSGLGLPTITYNANGRGQVATVNASTGTNPVSTVNYNASGQVTQVNFGSGDQAIFGFDGNTGRQTLYKELINGSAISGTINWNANGTPSSLATVDPFNINNNNKTCTFSYDDLIRVSNTTCTGGIWSQTFTYDPFGNITKGGSSAWAPGYNSANNHYTLGGVTYDLNGNLTYDLTHYYTWDANGQVLSVGSTGLTYDALGRQVERTNGAGYVQYVYMGSTKLALMNGQTLTRAFIPLPGGTQAVYEPTVTKYRVPDWLGSFRIESTSGRAWSWSNAFAPFGERYAEGGAAAAKTFAGHNWDTVSDLYDAQFREQSGAQGRWISPDPAGISAVDPTDPQQWNRYPYVRNNPLLFVDPFGLQDDNPPVSSLEPNEMPKQKSGYDDFHPLDQIMADLKEMQHMRETGYRGPWRQRTISAYHPHTPIATIGVDHSNDAKKANECLARAVWAGVKSAVQLPPAVAGAEPKGSAVDMAQKAAESMKQNASADAAVVATAVPAAVKYFPDLASVIGTIGRIGSKATAWLSVGLVLYEGTNSFKEQADAGECVQQ